MFSPILILVSLLDGVHPPRVLKLNFDGCALDYLSLAGFFWCLVGGEEETSSSPIWVQQFSALSTRRTLKISLHESSRLNPLVEGDSTCAIQWASQSFSFPWYLVDIIEVVIQQSSELNLSLSNYLASLVSLSSTLDIRQIWKHIIL